MTEDERLFELQKDAAQHKGMQLILEDFKKNLNATDTLKQMPLLNNGVPVVSLTERMMLQSGYVQALEWVIGVVEHYRDNQYQPPVQEEEDAV